MTHFLGTANRQREMESIELQCLILDLVVKRKVLNVPFSSMCGYGSIVDNGQESPAVEEGT